MFCDKLVIKSYDGVTEARKKNHFPMNKKKSNKTNLLPDCVCTGLGSSTGLLFVSKSVTYKTI